MRGLSDMKISERKAFYVDLVRSWTKESSQTIAERWGLPKKAIGQAAHCMRKKGIDLPYREGGLPQGYLQGEFLGRLKEMWSNEGKAKKSEVYSSSDEE